MTLKVMNFNSIKGILKIWNPNGKLPGWLDRFI
jgi:hypothetical protein